MELSTSVTAVFAVMAVLGLGYYGTDYVFDDSGLPEEDLNDTNTPGVGQETGDGDGLGEDREIKGRDNNDSENGSGGEASNEEPDGIVMSSDPVAGENTRIVLYDEGSRVTSETVYLDGEEIGETSQTGALTFEAPNKEEIELNAENLDPRTFEVEGYNEASDIEEAGLEFEETLYQGRENTLQVTGDGSALQDATVYVNNVEQGLTDSNGEISVEIPEEESIEAYIEKNGNSFSEAFSAEAPPIDITWFGPEGGINSYEAEFDFNVELQEPANLTLTVDGVQMYNNTLYIGSNSITETVSFTESGTKEYSLKAVSDSETRTREGEFEITQDMPPIDININSPAYDSTVDSYKADIEYGFDSPEDFSYSLEVDGRELESLDLLEGQGGSQSTMANCLMSGSHTVNIQATGEETGSTYTETQSFETSVEQPLADLIIRSPEDGSTVQDSFTPSLELTACQGIDYSAEIRQDDSIVETVSSGTASQYENLNFPGMSSIDLDSGQYSFLFEAENGENTLQKTNQFMVE